MNISYRNSISFYPVASIRISSQKYSKTNDSRNIHGYSSNSQKLYCSSRTRVRSIRHVGTDRRDALPGHRRYQEQRPVYTQHAGPHLLLLRGAGVVVRRIRSGFLFHTSLLLNTRAQYCDRRRATSTTATTTATATLPPSPRSRLPPPPPPLSSP